MPMILTYYRAKGTADRIRLLLHEAGYEYEERQPDLLQLECSGKPTALPILQDGDTVIHHPNAIMRYLADKAGLYGRNEVERAACDYWQEQLELLQTTLWKLVADGRHLDPECIKTEIVPLLAECEEQMSKNNTYHLVGGRLTFVDIFMLSVLDSLTRELGTRILEEFKLLAYHHQVMSNRPRIKAFYAKRNL